MLDCFFLTSALCEYKHQIIIVENYMLCRPEYFIHDCVGLDLLFMIVFVLAPVKIFLLGTLMLQTLFCYKT